MARQVLSETERVQQQTNKEWLEEFGGANYTCKSPSSQIINLTPEIVTNEQNTIPERVLNAGIIHIRHINSDKLLITLDTHITDELGSRIKKGIHKLEEFAEPDTGESLYEYIGYRTFFSKRGYLAVMFREISTGVIAERYFNVELKNKKGEYFKTGINCEFRIVGNSKRLQEGMFLKFWLDAVKQVPNDRPSQIWRYMNSKLSSVVVSCSDSVLHYETIKLKKLNYEGHLYQIT